ncbi:DUF1003 domain-containing protein [Sinorhizobium medicae]|nr:DUF1003 domain-containing protein [Sinorhizobium medicae]MDX0692014.1 DUF1003 domain-containing protein [Sinorhizobium medicae]MDX0778359.1 DUF1003 domain-containing protein [Sinorhizobium medicae]
MRASDLPLKNESIAELADRWLDEEPGDLTELEQRVLRSAIAKRAVSTDRNEAYDKELTVGERVADGIARIGGSWMFIFAALGFLLLWTVANSLLLGRDQFDPYPYILLNLLLSMLAALQAPVIMMSQNRQAARDRMDAAHDYQVNLKAEIEILALHDKLDEMRLKEILQIRDQLTGLTNQSQRIEKSRHFRESSKSKSIIFF